MTGEGYAEQAEKHRARFVLYAVNLGHGRDDAEDIVQSAIIRGLRHASRFRISRDVQKFLSVCCLSSNIDAHRRALTRTERFARIDDVSADELSSAAASVDPWEETDKKLDVQRALRTLSVDDRELARLLFLEGFTYEQVLLLYADRFTSMRELHGYVTEVIKPLLRDVLAEYGGEPAPPCQPLRLSVPTFGVYEQVFNDEGYELEPVTAVPASHQTCREHAEALERRHREDELECREDWDQRETTAPLRSTLQHLGNRKRTRLFLVRKQVQA